MVDGVLIPLLSMHRTLALWTSEIVDNKAVTALKMPR